MRAARFQQRMAEPVEARSASPIDAHVGDRVRRRRRALGVSQEQLADKLGLTFQQVQKYERGTNRISASKLYQTAAALEASIGYFFEGLPDPMRTGAAAEAAATSIELPPTPEERQFAGLLSRIESRAVRKRLLELVRSLAGAPAEDGA